MYWIRRLRRIPTGVRALAVVFDFRGLPLRQTGYLRLCQLSGPRGVASVGPWGK